MTRRRDLEGPVHLAILTYLRAALPPEQARTLIHVPNEIRIGNSKSSAIGRAIAKAKQMGARPGWPDLQWIGPGGVLHSIEVKHKTGTVQTSQKEAGQDIQDAGGRWAVCRSIDDARAVLRGWGYKVR